ncbi:DUF3955 domain-containing protein [Pseudobacillus badius]|uniref:DUF3955 domain-containing protein n=1 Tax=Bacillus badius TaxID=1455 RepID=UPI003CEBEA54
MKSKKHLLSFISILIGAICLLTYEAIGTKVEPDGALVEPFFLLPLSYLFIFVGIILLLFTSITSVLKRK